MIVIMILSSFSFHNTIASISDLLLFLLYLQIKKDENKYLQLSNILKLWNQTWHKPNYFKIFQNFTSKFLWFWTVGRDLSAFWFPLVPPLKQSCEWKVKGKRTHWNHFRQDNWRYVHHKCNWICCWKKEAFEGIEWRRRCNYRWIQSTLLKSPFPEPRKHKSVTVGHVPFFLATTKP